MIPNEGTAVRQMVNLKQNRARQAGMAERAAALMQLHFPHIPEAWVWRRKASFGFTTVPRTLPIAMEAIDHQSKGQPAGHTLFCLWARSPDGPLVVIENPATFAAEAGFTGARATDTWRRRMKCLRDHQFLLSKSGPSGDFHYVLLLNPNVAVEWMRGNGKVQDGLYGRFRDRVAEVGASGEIEAIRAHWAAEESARVAALQAATAAEQGNVSVPPPPPVEEQSATDQNGGSHA